MAHLIDKDALVAEIENRIKTKTLLQQTPEMSDLQEELQNKIDCLNSIKGYIINTLEVKEVDLQEEPVSIWHDMSEEVENGRNIIIIDPKDFYGAVLRKGGSQLRNHNKERYVKWAYIDDIINVTNKEEPVSEDLEKAAEEWDESLYLSDAFKAGAKWQKERMMTICHSKR